MTAVDLQLAGKSIIVTGGSSGIGFAAAQLLLAEGAMVTICGRGRTRLDEAASRLDSSNLHTVRADVLDSRSAARAIAEAVGHGGRLDGVAAVAAVNVDIANAALALIEVDYEVLPAAVEPGKLAPKWME